jgi:hypothetical protein
MSDKSDKAKAAAAEAEAEDKAAAAEILGVHYGDARRHRPGSFTVLMSGGRITKAEWPRSGWV